MDVTPTVQREFWYLYSHIVHDVLRAHLEINSLDKLKACLTGLTPGICGAGMLEQA
jgi:hypothetical protein